jgi:transcription initiation factor TFIID subunit 8
MSRKRSASVISVDSDTKRPKHATPEDEPSSGQQLETSQNPTEQDSPSEWADEESFSAVPSLSPTLHHIARCGIQRSIAMVLSHDGFQSASPEALESFTGVVETCRHLLYLCLSFFTL